MNKNTNRIVFYLLVVLTAFLLGQPIMASNGGTETSENHSWMVALTEVDNPNTTDINEEQENFFCGGVLVHPEWVLTAQHCVDDKVQTQTSYQALIGAKTRSSFSGEKISFTGSPILYGGNWLNDDIALWKLSSPSSNTPIQLVSAARIFVLNNQPSDFYALGWGYTGLNEPLSDSLRQVKFSELVWGSKFLQANLIDQGICPGDSGGPLVVKDYTSQWALAGLNSAKDMSTCGYFDENSFNSFTNVSNYNSWIYSHISSVCHETNAADVYLHTSATCGGQAVRARTTNLSHLWFDPISIDVPDNKSILLTNSYGGYLCTDHDLHDLTQDFFNPTGEVIYGNLKDWFVYDDTTCGGIDLNHDGSLDAGIEFQEPQSAVVYLNGTSGNTPTIPTNGYASLYSLSNYASLIGNYGLGSHTFNPNTYIHSVDLEGAGSFIVYAADGRSRCFNEDIPNLQDHEEWWKDTIRMDVYGNDVCPTTSSGLHVEIWQEHNYTGNKLGNFYVGTHTFPENTLMFSTRFINGTGSFVVHAPDGRSRCFNEDMWDFNVHEEWWRETIRMDVYDTDVCAPFGSSYSGIIGHWGFDAMDGAAVVNTAGLDNFYVTNTSAIGPGLHGNGLVANGTTNHVYRVDPSGGLRPKNDDPFTVSFWVQGTATSGVDYEFLSNRNTNGNDSGWWLRMEKSAGQLTYFYGKNECVGCNHATGLAITGLLDGQPHHVAVTFTGMNGGKNIRTYKDGILVDNKTISGGGDISYNPSMTLFIAKNTPAVVDELKIYRSTLTSAEVMDLYLNDTPNLPKPDSSELGLVGSWDFDSVSGTTITDGAGQNNLTATSASVIDATGIFSQSLQTDGVNYVYDGSPSAALQPGDDDPFTVEFWIDGETSSGGDYQFLSNIHTNTTDAGWWIYLDKSTGSLVYFYAKGGTGQNHATGLSISGLLDGEPHHVAVTFEGMNGGKAIRTYKDGVLVDDTTIAAVGGSIAYHSNMAFYIAKNTQADVDNVRIYNRELSAAEVAVHYLDDVVLLPAPGSEPVELSDIATNWPYSQTLTIDHTQVAGDLTDFPVLITGDVIKDHVFTALPTQTASFLETGVSTANLAGYWNFDETSGTTFADYLGNNNFTASTAAAVGSPGVFGNGLSGNGYAYKTNTTSALKPGNETDFSVSFWVQGSGGSGTDYSFLSNIHTNTTDAGWWLAMNKPGGSFTYFYGKNGTGQNHATGLSMYPLLDGNLHHVVVTFTGMNGGKIIKTYRDGVLIDNKAIAAVGASIAYHNTMALRVAYATDAMVDDLAIFNRVLSDAEVQQIYAGNTAQTSTDSIRFTSDAEGFNELAFEIVSFDPTTGEAEIWVKTDLSANVDTPIYMWYGNENAQAYSPTHMYGSRNVWSSYKAVYHNPFAQTDSTGTYTLSSVGSNGPTSTEGAISSGTDYGTVKHSTSGSSLSRAQKVGNDMGIQGGTYTIQMQVRANSNITGSGTNIDGLLAITDAQSDWRPMIYTTAKNGTNLIFNQSGIGGGTTGSLTIPNPIGTVEYEYLTLTYNGSLLRAYHDGIEVASMTVTGTPVGGFNPYDGVVIGGVPGWNGIDQLYDSLHDIDEVRISAQVKSPEWIATESNVLNSPETFFVSQ